MTEIGFLFFVLKLFHGLEVCLIPQHFTVDEFSLDFTADWMFFVSFLTFYVGNCVCQLNYWILILKLQKYLRNRLL